MKKKVFSLMMTLLLAFIGVAKADVVTIGEGTGTTYYFPIDNYFNYSCTEQIYLASEIGTAGTINSISFYYNYGTAYTANNVTMYMKNVSRSEFASTADCEPLSASDIVWTGSIAPTEAGWYTFTLTTPFQYDGTSNLLVAFYDGTSGYPGTSYTWRQTTSPNSAYMALRYYSDSTNPDPYNLSSYTGSKTWYTYRSNVQIDITAGGGAGAGEQIFAYQDGVQVDTVFVGPRPNGCWMEPFTFQIHNDGAATTITNLDWTPEEYFTLVAPELPVQIGHDEDIDVLLNTGESNYTDWQMVAIYGTGRTAAIWNINVEPYNPAIPDVVEMAYDLGTVTPGFSYQGIPSQITPTELHNDYDLPFDEIEEGYDAVYKLVFANDMMLNASVTSGENGKVALYTEDFYGEGGPMATNNYNGPMAAGGGAAAPFEALIGDPESTSTTGYNPMYYLYNYSLSTGLYTAAELAEAGATTAPMTSVSWFSNSTYGYNIQNVSIWMANVADATVSTASPLGSTMTLVYQGNHQEVVGENEFVFNQGSFAWDGTSNVLVMVQMNNGSWSSSIAWQSTNPGFQAMSYAYTDSAPYNAATTSYSMYTSSTSRANIVMKSAGREAGQREIVEIGEGTNTTNVYPTQATYNYCFNEMIYPAASIGMAGTINSIGWHFNGANALNRNVVVYMKNVTRSNFATTTDWEAVTASDIVYSGTLTSEAVDQWVTLTLDTPFAYDGTSNLMVAIDDNTGTWDSRYWYYTTGADNCCMTYYNDNINPDPYNISSYTASGRHTTLPNVQLGITTGGAPAPVIEGIAYGPEITNAPVEAGTYYLVASSTDADFEVTINAEAMPCPTVDGFAFSEMPADDEDEVEPASVTLQWMMPAYATSYQVFFGSTYYPQPNHPQTVISDVTPVTGPTGSFTVHNLWNNNNYFWYVVFYNDGACTEGVESPHWGFTTHLNIPQNLRAADETVFNDETIQLSWNAVVDRTFRTYFIYRDGVKVGETTTNNIGATTYTDGPLPYNMNGYTYYVTAIYDEGESAPSNTVNVKVSGRGNVNGHVYEQDGTTGIAGATVTMVGQDEFGVSHTYNFQTNAQGYYSGAVYAGSYNGSAACNGYQTIDAPVQGNPIDITYNQTTTPIDYILDENFDPVCAVIAEYYPDSLDPQSPYVKVYWGCGLPGSEIIEDFETGDFSMFDWNTSGSYPWEVTTTHPYEGVYCMRSTNYNVASSTSSIDVTVDIPADGIMSFYAYISSESSWDYGYFYIDGVQKGSYTGAGNSWGEKKFDITEGSHNFKWEYTKDGSVNSNEDRFYIDYITFYKQPEPAQPGWHTYCESEFNNAVGSNVSDTPSWAYEYPASFLHANYAGWNITKVSLFSDNMYSAVGGNYTCRIYVGGTQPAAGTMVSTITVDVPSNQNAWVDWDLTTPVPVTGNDPIWVVWTANTHTSSWPAGCCGDLNDLGTWWDGGNGWEHLTYGTWTMRHWFTNRAGRSIIVNNISDANTLNSNLRTPVKGEESNAICANENAVKGAALENGNTRRFSHYRVYRTDCYNDGPYTLYDPAAGEFGNTVVLACELHDTIYIDVDWPDVAPGVYKWGVGCVYVGNRGEEYETPIQWAAPVVHRNFTTSEAAQKGPKADVEVAEQPQDRDRAYLQYSTETFAGGVGTGGGAVYWGIRFPAADLAPYAGQTLTKVGVFTDVDGDYGWTYSGDYTAMVYQGGATAPGTLVSTATEYLPGDLAWHDITLTTPVTIDATQDLWLCFYTPDIAYPMSGCDYVGNANSDFLSLDGTTWEHATSYNLDYTWMIRGFAEAGGGGGGGGATIGLQEPRESEIVWSNCLDKDMYLSNVDVTVLLNSADSPEGTTVKFTNYNEAEQEMYPVDPITLDETGFYAFESFRRGDYKVKVELEGYEPVEDSVHIWDETHLRYVLIEILYGVENVYVSRTGWAMWDDSHNNPGGGGGGGGQGGSGDTFEVNFDNGIPTGWTTIDGGTPTGYGWQLASTKIGTGYGHNGSDDCMLSQSYDNNYGVVYPDNYLVSPAVNLANGSTFSFWACAQDASYAAEHFGVFISDNGTSDWTMVQEWTMTAKGEGVPTVGRDNRQTRQGSWYQKTVDLSAYAGTKYIAIRHFNCSDMFYLDVDDIELTNGAKNADEMEHFEYYKVMCTSIDGVPIYNHNTVHPFCQLSTNEPYNAPLVEGEHYLCKVAAVYSTGMSAWSEPVEWEYEPCDHWGPVDEVTVNTTSQGNHIEWVFEHGFNPYDPGTGGGGGAGDTFTEGFEGGLNGWTVLTVNADGGEWIHSSQNLGGYDYTTLAHTGSGFAMCYSYVDYVGAYNTDSYLITPQKYNIVNGSTLTFFADNANDSYPENFSVCVATADNPSASDFTQVWSGGAKGNGGQKAASHHDANRYQNWRAHSIDLSAYAGQNVYIAFHDVNYDMYEIWIDDVELTTGAKGFSGIETGMMGSDAYALNITDFASFDERVFVAYNLMNDSRLDVVSEGNGLFIISLDNAYEGVALKEVITDFLNETSSRFAAMEKEQAAETTLAYKSSLSIELVNALMMDVYTKSRENNLCELADPFCTDNGMYEFPAGVNAGSGETGPDYDCLYTTPNPAWYYMQIGDPGAIDIYMYSTPAVDIDFCCWGPFDDPHSACPNGLTEDKVVSCSYSANPTEHCMIPATAQTGEYYILVITNYSNQACNINFSAVAGSGTTNCGILPPVDIIGFLITQDGEYLAFADPTDREYTDIDEFGDHEYCVRPIYPGEMVLPSNNFGWSMGCPVCAENGGGQITCEPGWPIHGDMQNGQVRVWWGTEPAAPIEDWLYYDDGENVDAIGLQNGGTFYWGIKFPASSLAPYEGCAVTKVAYFDYAAHSGVVKVYQGSNGNGPSSNMIGSYNYTANGTEDWVEWSITPASFDNTQDLWIVMSNTGGGQYVASMGNFTGDDNGTMISTDGSTWYTLYDATGGAYPGTWNLRCFVSNQAKGNGQVVEMPLPKINGGELSHSGIAKGGNFRMTRDAAPIQYNVYRSTDNATYEQIGSVAYVDGQTYYEYIDTPATAGNYYYQVTAEYEGCESDPAPAFDNPNVDYVMVGYDAIGENDGMAIFPNPTKGNVTIQAAGMQHVTVVSVLGQVVYDADVDADEVILNMSKYTAGMYTVRVTTENGVRVERITVIR